MNSGFTQREQGFYPQNPKNLFVVKQRQSLIFQAAPLEWSKLKVIAWLAFGPSGWWPLAQADGTPMHYAVVWCCNSSSIFQWWFELHGASRRLHRLAIHPASSHWNSRNIHFLRVTLARCTLSSLQQLWPSLWQPQRWTRGRYRTECSLARLAGWTDRSVHQ